MPPSFKDVNVSGTPGNINDRSQFYGEGEKLFVKKVHKRRYIHLENQSGRSPPKLSTDYRHSISPKEFFLILKRRLFSVEGLWCPTHPLPPAHP